ncbi:HAD-IIA family hydrolase [Evansella cellulosilytica]|uniref:HAD-superfamily hydrolase, subfamily IIA n=1 Tax=Evansella cellulosilytica (strain ATCC 21833 / DSM 2522 / FERM P-1141 / JCM 9156 / N-4) TaxID=649639 RepID=E6TU03_EVAC2|nr:HAD-IIA family hydrolase [Evansella cellulosilytica]ADU32034.1 HAD-superfamily hydrolase, subfamily IIA [Evansella cellulosilytica DSM 2522]
MNESLLLEKKVFLFDLDGCIYHGHRASTRAAELIAFLRGENKQIRFITNNSTDNAIDIQDRLLNMGIQVATEEIITATDYIGLYLKERFGEIKVKVVGSIGLKKSIIHHGHVVLDDFSHERAEVIIIGRDVTFCYEKLKMVVNEEKRGAIILGTNMDAAHPGLNGEIVPETGSLIAAIETITSNPIMTFGKPSPYLFTYGMESCDVKASECVMIGDNYDTDVVGAMSLGISSVWLTDVSINALKYEASDTIKKIVKFKSIEDFYMAVR